MTMEPGVEERAAASGLHKVIVGIQFCTDFIGISWASTDDAHVEDIGDVQCMKFWLRPNHGGHYSREPPLRLQLETVDDQWRTGWAHKISGGMQGGLPRLLVYDPDQNIENGAAFLADGEGEMVINNHLGKSATDICADLLIHAAYFATCALARNVSNEVLEANNIGFVFTLPAGWSTKARMDTFRATCYAEAHARFYWHEDWEFRQIYEPEAAAIAALTDITLGGSEAHVKIGDGILVCDCGRETVDVTVQEIEKIEPTLEFKNVIPSVSSGCGSAYIKDEFIRWMEEKFGDAYTNLRCHERGPGSRMMRDFEDIKRECGKVDDPLRVYEIRAYMEDAVGSEVYDELRGLVILDQRDLERMFTRVIGKIVALLNSQLDAARRETGQDTITTVVLVGGFGNSAYVQETLRGWCQARGIQLLCPRQPQSAIVRGAALSGLGDIKTI